MQTRRCGVGSRSRTFDALEINGAFYTQIKPEIYERWRAETPDGFKFALEGHRFWVAEGRDVHVYFDNDAEGHAVRNARSFAALKQRVRS